MHRALIGLAVLGFVTGTATAALYPDAPSGVQFGSSILDAELADVDGDGVLDLVGARDRATIEVALGLGDGTFGSPVPFWLDHDLDHPAWWGMRDFDGDGRADALFLTHGSPRELHVFRAGPGLDFLPPTVYPIDVEWAGADLFVGDLDGDADTDLAVVDEDGVFRPFLNVAGFLIPTTTTYVFEEVDGQVAFHDVTGDGLPDVLVRGLGDLSLYRGTTSGALVGPVASAGIESRPFDAADLDGDGTPELATTSTDGFVVHPGLGDGAFGTGVAIHTGGFESWIRLVDVTQDGIPDLVGEEIVFPNEGDGTFGTGVPTEMLGPEFADLDRDGLPENVASGNPTLIARGVPGGIRLPPSVPGLPGNPTLVDLDLDGRADLTALARDAEDVGRYLWVAPGRSDRALQAELVLTASHELDDHGFGRIDGDAFPDLVVVRNLGGTGELRMYPGTGDGGFDLAGAAVPVPLAGVGLIGPGDLDGDGRDDVVVSASPVPPFGVLVVRSNGAGGWHPPSFQAGVHGGSLADIDGDGRLDLVASSVVYPGLGDGTFGSAVPIELVHESWTRTFADVDLDGDLDGLSTISYPDGGSRLFLHEQTETWTFEELGEWAISGSGPVHVADVDLDGHADVLVADLVLRGQGGLAFAAPLVVGGSGAGTVGDLDGDGAPDLLVPGYPSRVLWNDTPVVSVGNPSSVAPSGWLRAVGTPFRTRVRIDAAPGTTSLTIHDVAGRTLRTWRPARAETASTSWTWDGRDADGRAVPAGVYFVTAPDAEAVRLVRVR